MEPARPELVATRSLYGGSRISLRLDTLRFEGRPTYKKEIVEHPGSVVILPIADDGRVLFVEQWRPAAGKVMLELPSGTLEEGEAPDVAAGRELREETGHSAKHLKRAGGLWVAPGYSTEYAHIYHAEGLVLNPLPQDVGEDIQVKKIKTENIGRLILSGELDDSMSVAVLSFCKIA